MKCHDFELEVISSITFLQAVLTVQKKGFDYHDRHSDLFSNSRTWVRVGLALKCHFPHFMSCACCFVNDIV